MDAESLSERELLDACIQGNKESWDAFVRKYTSLVNHTIEKVLHVQKTDSHYQDMGDIHNNLFLSLIENDYKKLRRYEGRNGCTVSSWLMVVTSNFVLNLVKKEKQQILNNTTDNVYEIEGLPGPQEQPDEGLLEKEHEELFKELISDLNANDMLFLELYYREELPPESIAEILSITVSTVYSKKTRIREKLIKIAKNKDLLQGF